MGVENVVVGRVRGRVIFLDECFLQMAGPECIGWVALDTLNSSQL
jgi:hypothetical protein